MCTLCSDRIFSCTFLILNLALLSYAINALNSPFFFCKSVFRPAISLFAFWMSPPTAKIRRSIVSKEDFSLLIPVSEVAFCLIFFSLSKIPKSFWSFFYSRPNLLLSSDCRCIAYKNIMPYFKTRLNLHK